MVFYVEYVCMGFGVNRKGCVLWLKVLSVV